MNKKILITTVIGIIVLILLSILIFNNISTAAAYTIGDTVEIRQARYNLKYQNNIMGRHNFNFFCGDRSTDFSDDLGSPRTFTAIAKIDIVGDTATLQIQKEYKSSEIISGVQFTDNTYANRTISLIYNSIKNDSSRKRWNSMEITSDGREEADYIGFGYDYGQVAIWKALYPWKNSVGTGLGVELKERLGTTSTTLWDSINGALQKSDITGVTSESLRPAFNQGVETYNNFYREASQQILTSTGVNQTYYTETTPESEKEVKIREDLSDGTTILGPFKYEFTGNATLTLTYNSSSTAQSYEIGKYNGSTFTKQNSIISGNEFYIRVSTSALSNVTDINFKISTTGLSLANTTTTIYFFAFNKPSEKYQPIINIEQLEGQKDPYYDSYKINKLSPVTITKQDISGNPLRVAGIKFEIYENNNKVGVLTTQANGTTNSVELKANTTYTLKETYNGAYGYKNASIADASITNGSIISQNKQNGELTFSITDSSTIIIKNAPELGNLTVHKTGNNGQNLEGVEFVLWKQNAYLKLDDASVTTPIVTTDSGLDITRYNVTTVNSADKATKFKTNSSGKIVINNLEIYSGKGTKYIYWLQEIENDNYGYKGISMDTSDINVTGGSKLEVRPATKEIKFDITANTTIKIDNTQELANLEIQKVGEDETKLENVEFIIQRDASEYLQLKNSSGSIVDSVKGAATINANNIANSNEYSATYISDKNAATKFITDSNGKVTINNVEVNKSKTEKYSYTAYEVYNPNYGYGSGKNTSLAGTATNLSLNQTAQIKITNTIDLGSLKLEKYDEDNTDIKLEDVGFTIEMSPSPSKTHAYLALYDKDGNLVPSIKGTATINRQNIATDTEYRVSYYCTEKAISEMTEQEKEIIIANTTTFLTESAGTLAINNLEVYAQGETKYIYKLIETTNLNYGFTPDSVELGNITLESNSTVEKELGNKQVFTKISGYVWLENSAGKSNNYDGIYTDGDLSNDTKLTDLYLTDENGNVTGLNQTPKNINKPIEIKLYDKETNTFIKTQPDVFSTDGEYSFTEVKIEELENYEVIFIYDGFYYTTVVEQLNMDNGSKVKEVETERTDLNSLFGTVKYNNEIVSENQNTVNTVTYSKDEDPSIIGHESTVSELNFDTTLSANTTETGYNLKNKYDETKTEESTSADGITNVNMGIVTREQPKLAIGSDIYSVSVNVNNKNYNYYYNGRQQHYNNLNGDEVGVKFEQETSTNRYTRTVYSSDVEAYESGRTSMDVSLIYKIQITSQSRTLTSVVKEITNYFDADYTIEEIGLSLSNNQIGDLLDPNIWSNDNITENVDVEYGEGVTPEEGKSYNSIKIPLSENGRTGLTLKSEESKFIYIKFNISENAIKGLLNGESTYHNATEIMSYSTYYGEGTGKQSDENGEQEYFCTEQRNEGEIYAGVDKSSQPGNIELKLILDSREGGDGQTPILDIQNYEDDTTSAPSLLLEATDSRKISGTIFEDTATSESLVANEKLGDGAYDEANERTIDGVKVELYEADSNGNIKTETTEQGETIKKIATYSNGEPAIATTDGSGHYTFGYDNETNGEHVGILPGDYVIQYTYNNKSYIVDPNGNKNLNVNDYKSTIITSEVIKNALNGNNNRWYTVQENNRYSDAVDNIDLRNSLDTDEVKYSTYKDSFSETYVMEAKTPFMDVGVEFTPTNEADALSMVRIDKLENVDFGIIERPDTNMIIEKEITGLGVTTQTGTIIIPKGNPSNPGEVMQYVKTGLDGLVSAEIDSKLLQGATLNLEYSVSVTNNCQIDYAETEYYLYGTGGSTLKIAKVKKVVDYLDATMSLDSEQNEAGIWVEAQADDLYNSGNGFISEEVWRELKTGNYHILITEQFNDLNIGEEKTVNLYTTKYLAVSNSIDEKNSVEIIELSGGRTIKESIPGNYNPATNGPQEPDDDMVKLQVTAPTGTTVNYLLYIIATAVTFTILVIGIVIIKKKIMK